MQPLPEDQIREVMFPMSFNYHYQPLFIKLGFQNVIYLTLLHLPEELPFLNYSYFPFSFIKGQAININNINFFHIFMEHITYCAIQCPLDKLHCQ